MSDDVKALIAEARTPVHSVELFGRTPAGANDLVRRLADALEASVRAPAVGREALAEFLDDYLDSGMLAVQAADELFASGILQDAAYCATCQGPHRVRAQQVREGNA